MPFVSTAQQRFAFGTHQPWAERWARETDFSKLPKRVRVKLRQARQKDVSAAPAAAGYAHGPGGLASAPGLGGKREKAWSEAARAAALEARRRNAKRRAASGGTASSSSSSAGRLARSGRASGSGRSGRAGRSPIEASIDRLQRAAERQAARADNRAATLRKLNIAPDGQQALEALRGGQQPDPAALARGGFIDAGLVEQARDGSYRLTASGRAALSAADAGDLGRAGDTISAARDRATAREQRRQAAADRKRAAEQKKLAAAQRRAELAKRRTASGGRASTSDQPAAETGPEADSGDAQQVLVGRLRGLLEQARARQARATEQAARRGRGRSWARVIMPKRVRRKAHMMSRDEEKAMFANLAKSGKLRRKKPGTAAASGQRKPKADEKKLPLGVKPGQTVGSETKAYGADPNTSYQLRHELVDMDAIQASNTAGGGINPKYDPTLQPRDRSRASSQAQIGQVAQNMNPEVLTTDFHRIDAGSPIVDAKGNVLSGNGRTLALQRAAELHPEKYAEYKAEVRRQAEALGIDPAQVDKMRNPVLVRRLEGGADPAAFAREANSSGTLRMSPLEQAKVDAGQISDRQMLRLHVTEGQDIDRALRDKANKPFIDDFLKDIPDNERANLLTRNGELNQMGLYRAKAAIYTRAFPGEAGERLAESMLESLDPDIKSVQNGLSGGLPALSRATALTRSGMRDRSLDLSDDLAKTIDVYARIKDNPALTENTPASQVVAKYLGQSSMFDRELNAQQERLLVHLDKIAKRPTEIRNLLERYAKIVEDQPQPGQASLFGDVGGLSRGELLDLLLGDTKLPETAAQQGLF